MVSNPPYFPAGRGAVSHDPARASMRTETSTLPELCLAAAARLRSGGDFCLVHRTERLAEVFAALQAAGLDEEAAGTAEAITLVALGALLTALGVYDDLAAVGRAGTLVPITGFSNSVAAPALEFKTEGLITGTAVKMFSIAGPVIVFGLAAGTVYGLILCLLS